MSHPNIAIIGAGPVGTILARLLSIHAPSASVTVFEGDISPDYRSQGGTLDLHTSTGLAALKEANLWNEFLKHARYDGESLKITDRNLKIYHQQVPAGRPASGEDQSTPYSGERPEIDRGALRHILVESLPAGVVRWGHKLKEVRLASGAEMEPKDNELVFTVTTLSTSPLQHNGENGITEKKKEVVLSGFDLIVGADGGWSRIRSQALSSTKPYFSGVVWQELSIPDAQTAAPEVYAFTNRGSVFAHVDYKKFVLQQMGDGSIYVSFMYRMEDEAWINDPAKLGFDGNRLDEAKAALGEQFRVEGWHSIVREAVVQAQGKAQTRGLYMLPVEFKWAHHQGFTLVGDAAHLMTPFAGEGVNVGMQDARVLAKAVQTAGEDLGKLDEEVAAFETEMFARAGSFQKLTDEMLHHWFYTENSPEAVMPKVKATLEKFYAQ